MSTDYGKRLRAARKHARLTQKQLAAACAMSQSNLAELEAGGFGSSFTPQLAAACGVSPVWLATGDGAMQGPPSTSESPARYGTPAPIAPAVAQLLAMLGTLQGARLTAARAILHQLLDHPEMLDESVSELERLASPPAGQKPSGRAAA